MHCMVPLANAGLRIFAASIEPGADPAPMRVCISSMKMMMSGFCSISLMRVRMRSSNCPRYFVPATTDVISSEMTRLLNNAGEVLCLTISCAKPSTMALLPTPGSPMRMGLFFFRRPRISVTRIISRSRPTTGSSLPSDAAFVRSIPKLSSAGVLPAGRCVRVAEGDEPDVCDPPPCECSIGSSSISSSSSSGNPSPSCDLPAFL